MRRLLLAAALAFAVPAGLAQAQAPAPAHAQRTLIVLDAKAFDPGLVVPPPPVEGSDAQKAELAVLRAIQTHRTPEAFAAAKADEAEEDIYIFNAALGPEVDLKALPATSHVLDVVRNDQSIIANRAKDYFKRPRPFVVDPSIDGCDHSKTKPLTSYPSGHATLGYSLGAVLANLFPDKAQAFGARADAYAYNRMVCAMHYRSDIEASRVVGSWVAQEMLKSPRFQPDLDAARAELKAKGLAR